MSIESIDDAAVWDGILNFFRAVADLSSDDSGVIGVVPVGDTVAPDDELMKINRVSGVAIAYLVLTPQSLGVAYDRAARSSYAGGTPASKVMRVQISAYGPEPGDARALGVTAAARLADTDGARGYAPIPVAGHSLGRRERVGNGFPDQEGAGDDLVHSWTEIVDMDVALDV